MSGLPRWRRAVAATAILLSISSLSLVACSSPPRPTLESGDTLPKPSSSTTGPTTTVPDPYAHEVATAKATGNIAVLKAADGPVATTLTNPTPSHAPLVFLVKKDLGKWLDVYLPIRPNGSTGFVRKADMNVKTIDWRIDVSLSKFNLKVWDGPKLFLDAPIAVARENSPTPGGIYFITVLIQPVDAQGRPNPTGVYGPWAYGLSGFSDTYTSFNGGNGQLGIHGTNEPQLIGQRVSHGCIRMRNADIDKLQPVLPLGVPVSITA
jgi:hypothetical protein